MLYSIFTTFWPKNLELIQFDKKTGFKPPARRWRCWKMIPLIDLASRCGGIWNNILGQRTKQPCPGRHPRRHLENDPFLYHVLQLLIQMQSLIWDFDSKSLESHVFPAVFSHVFVMKQVLQWPGPPEDTWMPMRVLMAFASCVVRWPKSMGWMVLVSRNAHRQSWF